MSTNFESKVLKQLTEKEDKAIAARNSKKATSALNSQISAIDSKIVDQEDKVAEAEEALEKAKYPTAVITDNAGYVRNIVTKEEAVKTAKADLSDLKKSKDFFTGLKTEFTAEVKE